jgi:hypothetical protein
MAFSGPASSELAAGVDDVRDAGDVPAGVRHEVRPR